MAKRKRKRVDFETDDRLPNTRHGNLARLQVHALEHYQGVCPGEVDGFAPNPPRRRELACPVCGEVKGLNEFNEEHAPQNAGHSTLGARACVVLTCMACNSAAGDSFEQRVGLIAHAKIDARSEVGYVRRDLTTGAQTVTATVDRAEAAYDLKAAFLIAFATLGYRFAFGAALRPIRQAILDGTAPPVGWGGPLAPEDTSLPPFTVNECRLGAVIVMGATGGWMMPAGRHNTLDFVERHAASRTLAWPRAVEFGAWEKFRDVSLAGQLFHADLCQKNDHQATLGPALPRGAWSLLATSERGA